MAKHKIHKTNYRNQIGKKILAVFLVLTVFIGLGLRYWTKGASAAWYNASWGYRQAITITNNGSVATYQVMVPVDTYTLSNAGKLQADCDDLVFTKADGTTVLGYWNEYCVSTSTGGNSVIWVTYASLPTGSTTIYMYYGNSSATATSSYTSYPTGINVGGGKDGSLSVSSDQNINTGDLGSATRSCADGGDAVNYSVTENRSSGTSAIVTSTDPAAGCLQAGDEILIINLQGTSSATTSAGLFETARLTADESGGTLSLNHPLVNSYNGTVYKTMVQRIPNYTSVTTSNANTDLTPSAWDGTKGGVMMFRANGTVSVAASTTINANALGYRGGAAGSSAPGGGSTGESYDGASSGTGGTGASNGETRGGGRSGNGALASPNDGATTGGGGGGGSSGNSVSANAAGGGGGGAYWYGGGGGGGGSDGTNNTSGAGGAAGTTSRNGGGGGAGQNTNATTPADGGAAGSRGNDATGTGGEVGSSYNSASGGGGSNSANGAGGGGGGGGTYGTADLTTLFPGSGGGGGGGSGVTPVAGTAGAAGGGIVYIAAATMTVTGNIQANGGAGNVSVGRYSGGGGGGAGGSVRLDGQTETLGSSLVTANGGVLASNVGTDLTGAGAGGDGIIAMNYSTTTGTTSPTVTSSALPVVSASGSEEAYGVAATGLQAIWKFDEGTGTSANDATTNVNTGTLAGTTLPTWQTEDQCVSGKCLYFNGITSKVTVANSISVSTISLWVKPASSSASLIQLTSSVDVRADTGTITTSGITSPTVYVNGIARTTGFTANQWNHVEITTSTPVVANAISIGKSLLGNLNGYMDEVRVYASARTAAQVKADFVSRGTRTASAAVLGNAAENNLAALSNGLVGYWKMEETATPSVDSSGNSNSGTWNNNVTNTTGMFGKGTTYDGVDDYLQVADSNSLDVTTLTISAWINATALGGTIVEKSTSAGTDGYSVDTSGSKIRFCAAGGCASSTTTLTTGTWTHIVVTYDGTTTNFYLNGVLDGTSTTITSVPTNSLVLRMGVDSTSATDYSGKLDEVRVYNRALAPSDITNLYNFAPGPVGYWKLDEKSGTSVTDFSGNANTGTWNGTGAHFASGKVGGAGNFTGSSNYINAGTGASLDIIGDVTFAVWIKTSTDGKMIIQKYNPNSPFQGFGIIIGQNVTANKIGFVDGAATWRTGTTSVTDGNWHHIAVTGKGTVGTFYIDGRNDGTFTYTAPTTHASFPAYIGSYLGSSNYFVGQMDEFKIYNYARTPRQITEDMNGGHPAGGSPVGSQVGFWKFDEGYGTSANNSGNGGAVLAGTLNTFDSPATSVSGWNTAGKFGKALAFDGATDYVSIGSNPSGLQITSDLTLSAWVNLRNNTQTHDIISKYGASGQFGYKLYTDTSGKVNLQISQNGTATYTATSSAVLATNTWYHVAGVYKPTTSLTVYVNGLQSGVNTTSIPSSLKNSTANVNIGSENSGGSNFMQGMIDEPKIYSGILTPDQIKIDMNRNGSQVLGALSTIGTTSVGSSSASAEYCIPGDSSTCTAPVGRWNFEERTGATAQDSSGNANSGTLAGDTKFVRGKVGGGVYLDGSGDSVGLGNQTSLQITGSITVEAWVNTTTKDEYVIDKRSADTDATIAWNMNVLSSTGFGYFYVSNGSTNANAIGTTNLADGNWHHIVGTFSSGSSVKLYVDGNLQATSATAITAINNLSANVVIGRRSDLGSVSQYAGTIDDVRIYNYARTPAQVAWDYNRGKPIAWWKMDECSGATLQDSGSNLYPATLTIGASGTNTSVGTCTSGTTTEARNNGALGKRNYAMSFDGTDDYAQVTGLLGSQANISFTAWFNLVAADSFSAEIISLGDYVGIRADTSGSPKTQGFYYKGGSVWRSTDTGVNYAGTGWHHMAYTIDLVNNVQKVYIDGNLKATTNYSDAIVYTGQGSNTFIGKHGNGATTLDFNGKIDDVRVYNYPLSQTQVKNIMNDGSVKVAPITGSP